MLAVTSPLSALLAQSVPISPLVILVLCVVAGVGTVLLLPSRREASFRNIGAVVLLAAGLILVALMVRMTAGEAQGGMGPYFWIFSAIAVIGAIRVITHAKPVYSALYFVLTVFASAGLFLLMWAEFMAAALILIYAGAILVTYVFVIMLAAEATTPGVLQRGLEHDEVSKDPVIAAAVGFALMGVLLFIVFDKAQALTPQTPTVDAALGTLLRTQTVTSDTFTAPTTQPTKWDLNNGDGGKPIVEGNTQELAVFLFQRHLVNVELAGLILTVSMIGAIVIARRRVVGDTSSSGVDVFTAPMTPIDDNPHSIPVSGTRNPRQKEYPET